MSDIQTTRRNSELQATQNASPADVVQRGRPVGLILHVDGTLRLFEDPVTGGLVVEVVGMHSNRARDFLGLLGGMSDVADEIMFCDSPALYPVDEAPSRDRHVRRHG